MKLLLYFADGFAWKYWQELDFMDGFWDVNRSLETLLGYSSTVLPSMLSGRYPRDTGIWTEYYLARREQTRLERLLTSHRIVRTPANLMRLVLFRIARKRGSPTAHRLRIPLEFSHLYARNPIDYRLFPPIKLDVPTLDEVFDETNLRYDIRFLEGSPDRDTELEYIRQHRSDNDVFFYFDHAVDAQGHHVGASSTRLAPEINSIARFLEQAWEVLGDEGDREMIMFSDHGMTDILETYDLLDALKEFEIGKDYLAFLDSSFARFWFPDAERRQRILAALENAPGFFLTQDDLEHHGLDFEDKRYGEEVLVASEGVVFHPSYISPTFFRTRNYPDRGTHGYWPDYPSSYGVFAYRGSIWKQDIADPIKAVDVFTVIEGIAHSSIQDSVLDRGNR